jgi:hypothetical protein
MIAIAGGILLALFVLFLIGLSLAFICAGPVGWLLAVIPISIVVWILAGAEVAIPLFAACAVFTLACLFVGLVCVAAGELCRWIGKGLRGGLVEAGLDGFRCRLRWDPWIASNLSPGLALCWP